MNIYVIRRHSNPYFQEGYLVKKQAFLNCSQYNDDLRQDDNLRQFYVERIKIVDFLEFCALLDSEIDKIQDEKQKH